MSQPTQAQIERLRSRAWFDNPANVDMTSIYLERTMNYGLTLDELERRGLRCWIAPRNVRPGRPFDDEIANAIETCQAMLLIFSEHCNDSEYIRREVTVAGESHKLVIPFRIEDVQPRRGLRVRLSDLHWIDGFVSRERALDRVARGRPGRRDRVHGGDGRALGGRAVVPPDLGVVPADRHLQGVTHPGDRPLLLVAGNEPERQLGGLAK